tara:strand:- start:198 stop:1406 length:1209 start_codon:yes stop_codon:yes gene_type:complete
MIVDSEARVVRLGPRLPPGSRVRVRTLESPNKSSSSEGEESNIPTTFADDATRSPRCDDIVTFVNHGWIAVRPHTRDVVLDATVGLDANPSSRRPETVTFACDAAPGRGGVVVDGETRDVGVCPGIEAAIMSMIPGERCAIAVPESGAPFATRPEAAPAGTLVERVVELVSFRPADRPTANDDARTTRAWAERMREEANGLFARGEEENGYARALRRYEDASAALERWTMSSASASASRDDAREVRELMVKIHINASIALAKMRRHAESIAHCDAALELDATAVKALYRRGVALEALGRDEAALESLRDALELSKDRSIREAFVRVRRRINEAPTRETREVYERMVQTEETTTTTKREPSLGARAALVCRERPLLASAVAVAAIASLTVYFSGRRDGDEHRR